MGPDSMIFGVLIIPTKKKKTLVKTTKVKTNKKRQHHGLYFHTTEELVG